MKVLYIVCGLLVSGLSSCIKQPSLTKQEVIAVIEKFDNAWLKKDLKSVDAVLAPSYVYFTQSGGTFSRTSLVQTAGSPEYTLDTMERSSVMVQLYGNSAVVSTRWRGKGLYKGASFNEDQRCSITIIKIKNKVEILSEHCTPIKVARILH
jgi:hypothetical protein